MYAIRSYYGHRLVILPKRSKRRQLEAGRVFNDSGRVNKRIRFTAVADRQECRVCADGGAENADVEVFPCSGLKGERLIGGIEAEDTRSSESRLKRRGGRSLIVNREGMGLRDSDNSDRNNFV